ncbi:MAG TPA: MFS transporter [Kouleothrix sp.]|uniref:MFS transporter n=1 Tax=Kouleothrix sp. TaxID=2779161 RepID=UPI002C03D645|nr:MFS transporter [Kouleothrix sp.]HRC75114.1 MFS transporter [Kouleothrix sp.]
MSNPVLHSPAPARQRQRTLAGTVLVLALSLALLGYVALSEANRTYPSFQIETLAAQGEVVAASLRTVLLAGLPLEQFPGFATVSQPILDSDRQIAAIVVADARGQAVFANTQAGVEPASATAPGFAASALQPKQAHYQVAEDAAFYRVALKLENKFEPVGTLYITMPRSAIAAAIERRFVLVAGAGVLLAGVYGLFVWFLINQWPPFQRASSDSEVRWLSIGYGLACLLMAAVVIGALVTLYADGIQAKTQALARSLQLRLLAPIELGLELGDFDQIDQAFKDSQALNPDISLIALTHNQRIVVASDPRRVGALLTHASGSIEYQLPLDPARGAVAAEAPRAASEEIYVAIPASAIYSKLWRSVKNFVVLLAASGFLSVLLFSLIHSFSDQAGSGVADPAQRQAFELELIKPFYFISVFTEGLTTSFLPQYFQTLARASSIDPNLVSVAFTAYFVAFVVALIPAGRFAERRGNRPLLILSACLVAASLALMAVVADFRIVIALRVLAGLGQGMLYIGVQSYILDMAAEGKKTQGAAIIVYGYNGGMISGTAMGALLVVSMGVKNVFILAAVIAVFLALYAARLIARRAQSPASTPNGAAIHGLIPGLINAVRDLQFVKSMLLIGIPAKAILTGVTIFALPLLLAQQHYAQEDIGQIIMLYSVGVLVSSRYIARLVDRLGQTTPILFIGAFVSGIGLILMGLIGWQAVMNSNYSFLPALVLSVGIIVLGVAHGCIHAPIVTHISNTHAADTLGRSTTASLYRFLERIGHMSGPLLVSLMLLVNQGSAIAIAWLGMVVLSLSLLFGFRPGERMLARQAPKGQQ